MKHNEIERAVDTVLSGLTVTPEQQAELLHQAMTNSSRLSLRESCPRKRTERAAPVKLKFRFSLSFGLSHMIVAAIVVVIVMVAPMFIQYQQTKSYHSEDEGWYIIQGENHQQEQTAKAEKKRLPSGYYDFATFEEAFDFLGSKVPVPTWAPERFTTYNINVTVQGDDNSEVCRSLSWTLVGDGDKESIIYSWTLYDDPTSIMTYVEQNGVGEHVKLANGYEIYCSSNFQYESAIWMDGLAEFFLGGSITRDEAIRMAESVQIK